MNDTIIDYYDTCEIDYRLFWDLKHSHAMHAGYWDETTKTLREALQRENQILAELASIKNTDRVLDSGCGIGGSSVYLAKEIGCQIDGITLSKKQVETATALALEKGVAERCSFHVMDFTKMTFPDNTFDVVWGIESYCHANSKECAAKEAFRVLKPGGRLIIADGFQLKPILGVEEKNKMRVWLQGWGCTQLESAEKFGDFLTSSGFQQIAFKDITQHVLPSSKRLYYISFPAFLMSKIGEWLRLRTKTQTQNILAAYAQYQTLSKRIWHYGIFTAVKKAD